MNTIIDLFVSSKYRKIHDFIFRFFVISFIGSSVLWVFTDYALLPEVLAILFVAYEVPNVICHWLGFFRNRIK